MKFNKFLSLCFAASLAIAAASCGNDDDSNDEGGNNNTPAQNDTTSNNNNPTVQDEAKKGRQDGVDFANAYSTVKAFETADMTTWMPASDALTKMSGLAAGYKEASLTYKTAFAEGAAATNQEIDDNTLQKLIDYDYTSALDAVNKKDIPALAQLFLEWFGN